MLKQKPGERCRHIGREQAANHRAETDFGHFAAALRRERADAADLDGDARKVCKTAQRVRGDGETARVECHLFDVGGEVEIAEKFVEDDAFTEDLANSDGVMHRYTHQPGKRRVEPAENGLQRGGVRYAEVLLRV